MSSNGLGVKKRKILNNDEAILESSTKKIKVQAQRKFAQNAATSATTPQKLIQNSVVASNTIKPPVKRPNTEDFLTFLCFRGTSLLPPRLDFFNKPQRSLSAQEIAAGKKRRKSTPILPVSNSSNSSNMNNEPSERKNIRQLQSNTVRISKLGEKVIGRNLVRSSSRYTVRQESLTLRQLSLHHGLKVKKPKPKVKKSSLAEENNEKETKEHGKQKSLDGKKVQKLKGRSTRSNSLPSIFCPALNQLRDDKGKWCKGNSSKTSSKSSEDSKIVEEERPSRKKTASKNLDHRSNSLGNLKQKACDIKCNMTDKNNRKTRSLASKHKSSDQDDYVIPDKKREKNLKTVSKNNKSNSLSETKLLVDVKRKTSSVNNIKTNHENKDSVSSTRSRPPRRTKEAATLFMEMLRKDMRCPNEQEEDDTSSVESFPDLPNTRVNEQRERELKVFSKKKLIENELHKQRQSTNKDKSLTLLSDSKKPIVENTIKEQKLEEPKMPAKLKPKEMVETITESSDSISFKRYLRPRRSSTMLDDYIMTDSDEDDKKSEIVTDEANKSKALKTIDKMDDLRLPNCKLSSEESTKKNLKINKTELKLKKDLNKIDSEVKNNFSETKLKSSLPLKHDQKLEINKIKNTAADKKIGKKNKTEIIVITNEPTKTNIKGSKIVEKNVPLSSKPESTKKKNTSKKKKLDLYNNNNSTKKKSVSSLVEQLPSIFSNNTSQSKEELLGCMAVNFDSKIVACKEDLEKSVIKVTADKRSDVVTLNKSTTTVVCDDKKLALCKQEPKSFSKTESLSVASIKAKEENVAGVEKKIENSIIEPEKIETPLQAVVPYSNKVEKMENTIWLPKEINVTMPNYFSSKNFQLSSKFEDDDGLSVLSEVCSTLPRFDAPFVSNCRQTAIQLKPANSMLASESSADIYTSLPLVNVNEKKEVKVSIPVPPPPSFESRTVKIVNLARGNSTAVSNNKKDLAASWRQAFKNVKLPTNGLLTSTTVSVANNLMMAWAKKKQSSDSMQTLPSKLNCIPSLPNGCATTEKKPEPSLCHKVICGEPNKIEIIENKRLQNSSYLAKTTILNSNKYDLKFEKRSSTTSAVGAVFEKLQYSQIRGDLVSDVSSSDDLQSPEKKIFGHQRRLSTTQSCNGNSSDAFSPDNETSVYAFQPDLPVASTPFRRNKPQSPAKSRTVSPNTSIAVSIENDSMEEKSHQSTVSSTTDVDSEEGRLFYIPLPAGVQAQPLIQGVTVKLGTEGPQNKLVMSAKLVTKPPASTIPVSSISPKSERKIKPLCSTKVTNSTTPVGTVQPTTRTVQPPKCVPSTSKQVLPLPLQTPVLETKDDKKRLQQITTTFANTISNHKESKKLSLPSTSVTVNKKIKKTEKQVNNKRKSSEKVASKKKLLKECAEIVEAPTFYPSEEDFKDPLEYFEIVRPIAQKYGICRVVPPSSFKPECKVSDDMRFTAYNQYVHKMMDRWGPNVRELIAMKKYLETQSIVLSNPPLIGGMELDLPRLYHIVQELGGLKEVIELDKWCRVADLMKIPKSAQDRVSKLDDIYCKYLLPYDTLSHEERQKLIADVDKEWKQICRKGGDTENELYEDVNDCITKGRSIALSAYYRVARNTAAMWFKEQQNLGGSGNSSSSTALATSKKLGAASVCPEDVELLYWKQVHEKKNHICVLSGSIDSGTEGYGFPTTKTATFTKHPWNLKVLTNNSASVLKSLGPVMGMTVPTIHMGMVFSACCWYKDPHGLPWIEYLHTGADKVWYGVPSSQSDKFQAAMKVLLPRAVAEGQNHHTWLAADSGMVPPDKLLEHGITITRTVQNPGQFLIVMPRAYTCNVSTGYVISESVYFTQPGWLNNAEKIFQDLQRNCEPAAFSLEKLLINMSTDSRTTLNILKQLLGLLSNMRDCEVALRSQLVEDLGLKASERIKPTLSSDQDDDFECGVCHSILYISMVNNSHDDCDYCLRHGIEILSKKHNQLKYCKLMYTFNENELDSVLVKLRERIDSKKKNMSAIKS